MNKHIISTLLCMLITETIWAHNVWQCVAHDKVKKQWIGNNAYERVATNKAIEACKKESTMPTSCAVAQNSCAYFVEGKKFSSDPTRNPSWQCTALDHKAKAWVGKISERRDDAALEAKAYCQEHSTVPDTCYINLPMCKRASK